MSKLIVRLFGRLTIERDGCMINSLPAGKLQELLCYLLLHRDRTHPREALASLLWGEHVTAASKKYLRQALWQLQSIFCYGSDGQLQHPVTVERDSVCLDTTEHLWVDVSVFEKAAGDRKSHAGPVPPVIAKQMREAVDLYRADLLEGWYQDWCLIERERLQNLHLVMLGKLMGHCEEQKEYEEGLEFGERILRLDRAHERTYQKMMRLQQLAGDRAGSLRTYQRCVTALREEIGVDPSETTFSLLEQIRANGPTAPVLVMPRPEPVSRPLPPQPVSLVELASRLRRVVTALSEIQQHVQKEVRTVERLLPAGDDHGVPQQQRGSRKVKSTL